MSDDEVPGIPPEELDMAIEEFTGKATKYGSTEEAITKLKERIAYLKEQMRGSQPMTHLYSQTINDLAQAETDLAAYQRQLKDRN